MVLFNPFKAEIGPIPFPRVFVQNEKKANEIPLLEIELAYYDITEQRVNHYTTVTIPPPCLVGNFYLHLEI